MKVIHKAKDNSIKMVLGEPELFLAFLRNFTSIDIFHTVTPSDIEDVTSRFLTLVSEQKDGDTVKRINLKGDSPLFVIAIVEHESSVNFRAPFKMLLYIALILDAYEKEIDKEAESEGVKGSVKPSMRKDFKYPPVLPIIFYDGDTNWTAETNILYRTEMHEIFHKYVPKFEYELVSLKDYSVDDLVKYEDLLSLLMIINKIKTPGNLKAVLSSLPEDYVEHLKMNVPSHLTKVLSDVIRVLLSKINAPQDEIEEIAEKVHERGISEMFAIENYDVQETRRLAREEGKAEGKVEGIMEGKAEGKAEGLMEGLLEAATRFLKKGMSLQDVADTLELTDAQKGQLEKILV